MVRLYPDESRPWWITTTPRRWYLAPEPAKRRHSHHPETLHYLARLLVGVREADQARELGGMFYDNLIQRVRDTLADWRASKGERT
ncbi:hypothetical protein ALI144C_44950 [Actinosynnema sp. ALI-1.44]|uniref:hypothetical protein n=1 Tax=Actinosynnema sp. ALI-1.44 TaxID=1933779 RepID=UPI00097CA269|nr:hypothetical protein [Actinosynnema sp. ALI-1.44]ONI73102.1 hypothetical protein ALI144C_44950 [Actinosynnema sp. ALI-1.44]